ncbi:MAG: phosphoglycerate kinase [Candidatus Bathyarchaeota archaeon B26-2]|nr:MAG: phosphoglycerate kinase [Candidatus Bathyarchaeota archaeon B26-2]
MPKFLTLDDLELESKVVLVRVDFNSPVDPETKKILDETRIRAHGESTIKELSEKGARVVVLAHQGRPGEPDFIPLKQHAEALERILGKPVKYVDDLYGEKARNAIKALKNGEILVLENTRTYPEERKKKSKSEFVRSLAELADIFVNDAFAAAHRSHASIVGFTALLPSAAGRIMERELKALSRVLESPEKPCVFILGGAKADDSLKISKYVLENGIADTVLTGGLTGHLFLVATGVDLGKPNMELLEKQDVLKLTGGIKELMDSYPGRVKVPKDVAVEADGKRRELSVGELPTEYPIYDIGTETIEEYSRLIEEAKSIVISGPPGVYEKPEFMKGTKMLLEAVASSEAFSLAGGGHTVAAIEKLGLSERISYISTAGGALIEFLMGERLPGVAALEAAASRKQA